MKKGILLFINILLSHFIFAQANNDFKTVVGKYDGHQFEVVDGEGKANKTVKVKGELNSDYTFSLSMEIDGVWTDQFREKLNPETTSITENGSFEYHFKVDNSESTFAIVNFNIMPPSFSIEGILISLKTNENKMIAFEMNREGGNPTIPDIDDNLSKTEKEKKLHQQMTTLFIDLEKGFSLSDGTREKDYTSYPSRLYIKGLTNVNLVSAFDNGNVYFYANILSTENSNSPASVHIANIENAIKSYSNSNGFQISALEKDKNYVVKKSGKAIGFLEIKKTDDLWSFFLHKSLDSNKLKTELLKGLELAENDFENIKKGGGENAFVGVDFKSTRDFYGATSTKINTSSKNNTWKSSFKNYPYSALLYQIEKMNITYAGANKTKEVKNDRGFFMEFKKYNNELVNISLYDFEKEGASIWISKNTTSDKPIENNEKIHQYIDNAKWQTKDFKDSYDEIVKLISKANNTTTNADRDNYLDDIVWKFRGLRAGTDAAIKEIENAKNEAKNAECSKTQMGLEYIEKQLTITRTEFLAAEGSFAGIMNGVNVEKNRTASIEHSNLAFDTHVEVQNLMNRIEVVSPCYRTSSSSNSSENSTTTYVEPAKKELENSDVGIGLTFSINNVGKVSVNNSHDGFAAKKAGIYEGMWILEIDGKSTEGKDKYDINKLLNGKKGTSVKVKFCRKYEEEKAKEYILYRGAGGDAENTAKIESPKTTTSPTTSASTPSTYPPFTAAYEGDNFFQLMGRNMDDPAIQKLINDSNYSLKKSGSCELNGSCWYTSNEGLNLKFDKKILIIITFDYKEKPKVKKFTGKVPSELPLGKEVAAMKAMSEGWEYEENINNHIWTSKKHQVTVKVYAQVATGIISGITLDGKDIDWNNYYQQF